MIAQVVKCNKCGMRYNGAEYSQCPYCAQGSRNEKKEFSWGRKKPKAAPDTGVHADTAAPVPPISVDEPGSTAESVFSKELALEKPKSERKIERRTQSFYDIPVPASTDTAQTGNSPAFAPEPQRAEPLTGTQNAVSPGPTMASSIQKLGKTTAKYIGTEAESNMAPPVGWLVCVKGVYFGQAFPLKNGMNKIGRSPEMDVALLRDDSISRSVAMRIAYDSRANEFQALPGESGGICYVSGSAMYERTQLTGYEEIEFSDTGLNKFVFIPLCGAQFRWENYTSK